MKDHLTRIETKIDLLSNDFNDFKLSSSVDIAKLKIKSGLFGVIGGIIPVIGAILFWLLKSK